MIATFFVVSSKLFTYNVGRHNITLLQSDISVKPLHSLKHMHGRLQSLCLFLICETSPTI